MPSQSLEGAHRCPMILASWMSSGWCIRPSVGPARPSPSSFELLCSPWRRCLALSTWSMDMRMRRWLYLDRMIVGTHQGHSRTSASASLLYTTTVIFLLPPGFLTSRSHTIVNLCSQYKRENCTRCGWQLGPSSSSSICVFEAWALQSFSCDDFVVVQRRAGY